MAEKILFTVEQPPQGIQNPFSGRQEQHNNPNFSQKPYQVAYKLEEKSECLVGANNNIMGVRQSPLLLWKNLDIDTPFFKECLIRNLVIGSMSFHFFHNRNDPNLINYFTIILKKVKVLESEILFFDTSDQNGPNAGLPYIEQLKLTASDITWQYSRTTDPRKASKKTVYQIGD